MKTIIMITAVAFLAMIGNFTHNDFAEINDGSQSCHIPRIQFLSYNNNFGIDYRGSDDELLYEVRGMYSHSITKSQVKGAKRISDIIQNYPFSWISSYKKVEISGTCNGNFIIASSRNDTLTSEQIHILNTIDMASDLTINIEYSYQVPITNIVEHNTMHLVMTIVPEKQAEYIGGYDLLIKDLKENSGNYFSNADPAKFAQVAVKFTINRDGDIVNPIISRASGDKKTDRFVLELVSKLSKWKPAENADGIKIDQDFVLTIGNNMGC